MFGLCDCNNFFASCERAFNPSLNDRPVVVLSNNDGCIIARSNQAKEIGLKMGQPLFQAKTIIERNNVAVFSSNYRLYGDMSNRVMATLKTLVPSIEIYSIDEAFLDLANLEIGTMQSRGCEIARIVKRNTGIPVSIGIAPTKTLAKIASKLCKKYPKLNGCCFMYREVDIEKVLKTFPIEDVWGIGRKYSKMLQSLGILTAYQFTQCPSEWVQSKMSIVGLRTWKELKGESCIEFEHTLADKQSICVSRSFARELTTLDELQTSISTFTSMACVKLRKQKSVVGQMQVFIYTNRHREDAPQMYETRLVKLEVPTDSTLELIRYAMTALHFIFRPGFGYKKAGVIFSNITASALVQNPLFDTVDRSKHSQLMRVIDGINSAQGSSTVKVASQGFSAVIANRDYLSPSYTTDWNEIITVKV